MNHEYKYMNAKTLRKLCASRKIKYCYKMNKTKMIEMLEKNDKDPFFVSDPETRTKFYKSNTKWLSNNRDVYNKYQKTYQKAYRAGEVGNKFS